MWNINIGLSQSLAWPLVALLGLLYYRKAITSLLSQSKVRFTISGITFETTLAELERSVFESLRGDELTLEKWTRLERLRVESRLRSITTLTTSIWLRYGTLDSSGNILKGT